MMASNGVRRKDTTKGPPLRILSLGMLLLLLLVLRAVLVLVLGHGRC
jgi:hypothetical protein